MTAPPKQFKARLGHAETRTPNVYRAFHKATGEIHYIYARFDRDEGVYKRPPYGYKYKQASNKQSGSFSDLRTTPHKSTAYSQARNHEGYVVCANAFFALGDDYEPATYRGHQLVPLRSEV